MFHKFLRIVTNARDRSPHASRFSLLACPSMADVMGWLLLMAQVFVIDQQCHAQRNDTPPRSASREVTNVVSAAESTEQAELVIDTGTFLEDIEDLAFSPDGSLLAAAGGKVVRVWRVSAATMQLVATLRGEFDRTSYGNCYAVEFTPDGSRLLVGVNDDAEHGNIRVYRVDNLAAIERLLPGHRSPCRRIAFSREGQHMISQDQDGRILIWNPRAWRVLRTIPPRDPLLPDRIYCGFPENQPCLMEMDTQGPHLLDIPSGEWIENPASPRIPDAMGEWLQGFIRNHFQSPQPLAELPVWEFRFDEHAWLAAGYTDRPHKKFWVSVWAGAASAKPRVTYDQHRWHVRCVALQPGGALAASGDAFGEIHVWNRHTGRRHSVMKAPGLPIYDASFDTPPSGRAIRRILFAVRPDNAGWKMNHYGIADQLFRLDERAIVPAEAEGGLHPISERPTHQGMSIRFSDLGERVLIEKVRNGRREHFYRLRSGATPTTYTVFDAPTAGLTEPIIFGDNWGMLALWDSHGPQVQRAYMGHRGMVTSLSVSPDRKLLLSSSTDRTLRIWPLDAPTPTGTFDFDYENTTVIGVQPNSSSARAGVRTGDQIVSIDGKSLREFYSLLLQGRLTARPDDRVQVVMTRRGDPYHYEMTLVPGYDVVDPLLNVFLSQNGDWIIWNPRGYYDASPGADRWIGFHVNRGPDKSASFFQVHQFRKQLYRPDIIDAIMELTDIDQAVTTTNARRAHGLPAYDFRSPAQVEENSPPDIVILQPRDGTTLDDHRITLHAHVHSTNGLPISDVTLSLNGATKDIITPDPTSRLRLDIRDYRLRLASGQNVVRLVARNEQATSSAEIHLNAPVRAEPPQNAHLLAIGVSDYQHLPALQFAHKDAMAIVNALQRQSGGKLYRTVQVHLLTDTQATHESVRSGFQWLSDTVSQSQDDNVAFLFFAGHGLMDRSGRFYLATADTDPDELRATAIDWRNVITWLHEDLIHCRKVVMIDACHSGAVDSIHLTRSADPYKDLDRQELGTVVFASCNLLQKSLEIGKLGHGAFTFALLESLRDKNLDLQPVDSFFTPPELDMGLKIKVSALTDARQSPVYFSPGHLQSWPVLQIQSP